MKRGKFSVIIPCYRHGKQLAKCIGSIQDQDWKEREIIVVIDGNDPDAENALKTFPDVRWTTTGKNKAGAPYARNIGAGLATGDYFLFLDADSIIYPGSLRTWAEGFEDYPNHGFIYSGYKIADAEFYPSESFSEYQLEINNYIDTSNPLRKEVFLKWDESLQSLQDWDLWLRIVKAGAKGLYVPNKCFVEKTNPGKGSISEDSNKNWLKRKYTIQKKLGLPIREVAVTSLAAEHHARRVAPILGYDYVDPIMLFKKPHNYKAVYLIGYFPGNEYNPLPFMDGTIDPPVIKKGLKKIVHWIGTDVLQMKKSEMSFEAMRNFVDTMNSKFTMFCQSEENQNELKAIGINADLVPLPVDIPEPSGAPLPKEFTVGIYDHGQNNIYCQPLMVDVIKAMPDVQFRYFGDPRLVGKTDIPNLKYLGRPGIQDVIKEISVLLRITFHDGLPVSVIEFLAQDRAVITNQNMPYTERINVDFSKRITKTGLIDIRRDIMAKIRKVKKRYPGNDFFKLARGYYRRVVHPKRLQMAIGGVE